MQPLFLGNHPAVDFLNSGMAPDGQWIETIGAGKAYLDWLVAAELLTAEEAGKLARKFGAKALDTAAVEARKVREWARDWLTRWRAAPQRDFHDDIATLNKLMARASYRCQLATGRNGLDVVDRPQINSADDLLALVAFEFAALVAHEQASLLKSCASDVCTLWFLDRTKGHRRLFCSASACGNRAKVAAYRERQRS
jgi:predicted RNA-binding Zn ribbon-like protein